ncbi:MAG TPA: metal ABC transporter permease [Solirubrobacteraceae bacterium]|nr:metal ABC transporter permease [Solirubrobacteraceae bacterium]
MFAHPFVRDAYLAGTFIALACGTVGWFAVLRGQVFATDALSHVAFVGAIAAAVIGVDERVGLFALTLLVAGGLGAAGERARSDDTVTGIALAWVLGIGVLLLAVLATRSAGATGVTTANTLFGSIYALSAGGARLAAGVAAVVTGLVWAAARPLLLASLEPELAVLRGVPVRLLAAGFMAALAAVTAESTQAVGALLLLGLIAAPAGASRALTARPYAGLALSAGLAVAAVWGGLALAYAIPRLPPSPAIIALAAGAYLAAALTARMRRRPGRARAGTDRAVAAVQPRRRERR